MNSVAGIIFTNLHDRSIPELTKKRTMGAIPFGGIYRMVDFPLSAMANVGIRNISVIAHHNYESLVEHIGSGADWGIPTDMGGVKIISPYMTAYAKSNNEMYNSRLETLKSICNVI
ncbi:MAG: glucose-1-phosphate adenylyltransferase subunit GlgD, partial [Clostridia bacterium]|nr:glucose-1-phosphate adenylyltransferase subunit GlgD [Clostridia bacterium]